MPEPVTANGCLIRPNGQQHPLADGLRIGRARDANVRLVDNAISREHALVHLRGDRWMLSDCGSRNGTQLNDTRLPSFVEQILRNGDLIRIGNVVLRVRIDPRADDEATSNVGLADIANSLSPYQLQVVEKLAEPWLNGGEPATNAEIAAGLGTPHAAEAVKAALRRCYAKAGIAALSSHAKRRELCRIATQQGWI